jgi:hypothetical protein
VGSKYARNRKNSLLYYNVGANALGIEHIDIILLLLSKSSTIETIAIIPNLCPYPDTTVPHFHDSKYLIYV